MATGTLKAVLSKNKFYSLAARAYSDTYLWKNGEFCTYGDKIYKFIGEDLISGENWNPAHWAETKLTDELESLAAQIAALDPEANAGIFTDVAFTIAVNAWTQGTTTWTYNYSNALIKDVSGVVAYYDESFKSALTGDIRVTKYTGYVVFETNRQPIGTLTGTLRIVDSVSGVLPVSRGGTGASTNKGARQNLNVSIRPIPCDFGTVSSLPQTIYDADITSDMVPSKWTYGNPAACPNGLKCTTATGSVTISLPTGGTFSGETTVYLELVNPRSSADGASGQQSESYAGEFVQIGAQTLTSAQKAQVLTNIGGASEEDLSALSNKITMWVEELEFNGTIFPTSKPVRGQSQYCVVARNISTGALYMLWNSASQGGFRHGATISGSDPVTGDKVYVCYPIN